jgi:hypothetical protein
VGGPLPRIEADADGQRRRGIILPIAASHWNGSMEATAWMVTTAAERNRGPGVRELPRRPAGRIFAAPIDGRQRAWTSLRTGGSITDTLRFTGESTTPDRCYFEWELEALGQRVQGVTVLTLDSSGLISNVALHHRPLGAVLAFSAEMGRRLGDSLGPDVFYKAAGQPVAASRP